MECAFLYLLKMDNICIKCIVLISQMMEPIVDVLQTSTAQ